MMEGMADTTDTNPATATTTPPILFRPSKKRKIYRHRAQDDDDDDIPRDAGDKTIASVPRTIDSSFADAASSPTVGLVSGGENGDMNFATGDAEREEEEGEGRSAISLSEILRLRKLHKQRVGGVEFRPVVAAASGSRSDLSLSTALIPAGEEHSVNAGGETLTTSAMGGVRQFTRQTGLASEMVDKHMMAYIDSELSKRRQLEQQQQQQAAALSSADIDQAFTPPTVEASGPLSQGKAKKAERQPASLGKLQEIDLGNEARDRNISRTELARRIAAGEPIDQEGDGADGEGKKPKKVRLGRDGKPWRPRKRRNSEDVKRDQLVEELMRENRLEMYDAPPPPPSSLQAGDKSLGENEDADEQIAEAFKREFLDAMTSRQQRRKPASSGANTKKSADEDVLKGPKLGGSRSTRAAMRDQLLKIQQAGKK